MSQIKNFTIFQFQSWATDLNYDPNRTVNYAPFGLFRTQLFGGIKSPNYANERIEFNETRLVMTNNSIGVVKIKERISYSQFNSQPINLFKIGPGPHSNTVNAHELGNKITAQLFEQYKNCFKLYLKVRRNASNVYRNTGHMPISVNSYTKEYLGNENYKFLNKYLTFNEYKCHQSYETQIHKIKLNPMN